MLPLAKVESNKALTLGLTVGPVDGEHYLRTGYYLQQQQKKV